eukprot:311379-Chlamydomonas_euryale.AAC.5
MPRLCHPEWLNGKRINAMWDMLQVHGSQSGPYDIETEAKQRTCGFTHMVMHAAMQGTMVGLHAPMQGTLHVTSSATMHGAMPGCP